MLSVNCFGVSGQTNLATVAVPGDGTAPAFTYPLFVNTCLRPSREQTLCARSFFVFVCLFVLFLSFL